MPFTVDGPSSPAVNKRTFDLVMNAGVQLLRGDAHWKTRVHLSNRREVFYAVRMTAQQRKESYFPELTGEEQREADEWLRDYLRLVVRIHREHLEGANSSYPQVSVDESRGTGKVRTANRLDAPPQ